MENQLDAALVVTLLTISTSIANGIVIDLFPQPPICGQSIPTAQGSRIFGGTATKKSELPWMVEITVGCGGSLINSLWVLTAAHCFDEIFLPQVKVKFKDQKETVIEAEICVVHEEYVTNRTVFYNDVALVKLKREVIFTDEIQPICLPYHQEATDNQVVGRPATVSGWGATERRELYSKFLLKTRVRIWNKTKCESYHRISTQNLRSDFEICAGGVRGVDACSGDSGGPLAMRLQGLQSSHKMFYYQIGIVSFGLNCGQSDFPGVYTNLTTYMPWIRQKILENI